MPKATICLLAFLLVSGVSDRAQSTTPVTLTYPTIVANVALTDQTTAIHPTPIFTPSVSGLYRMSGYTEKAGCDGKAWQAYFLWTDDTGYPQSSQFINPGGCSVSTGTVTVRGVAGKPLSFSVHDIGGSGATPYGIFITVEQLQ